MPLITYMVQAGDTVYKIARRFGVNPQEIIARNGLQDPDHIIPGQQLAIFVQETEPPVPPPGTMVYIVQPGDTLYLISQRVGVSVNRLAAFNNLADPNRLFPGQRLLLPPEAQPPVNQPPPGYFWYPIHRGDTIFALASRFRTTVPLILQANPGIEPVNLQIGQNILIPAVGLTIPVFRGNPGKKTVALTFDATYGDNQTDTLLAVLAENGIRATWFISGIWAENFPALLQKIQAAGHEIGNHSQTHPHMTKLPPVEMRTQITEAARMIRAVTGMSTGLFRPPFGEYDQTLLDVAAGLGYRTIMWTIDTLDWQNPGPDAVVQRVAAGLQNGAIILMHNAAPDTATALPRVIQEIQRQGYGFGTVSGVIDP
ncbi:MAG: LysM peptidoglycan-binding domain-containing protein [Heliobacteriaceae bacterium]|nr:LysM peptidoglycan-binding domain-containing protein [Heliobacteriaceae bacterium]